MCSTCLQEEHFVLWLCVCICMHECVRVCESVCMCMCACVCMHVYVHAHFKSYMGLMITCMVSGRQGKETGGSHKCGVYSFPVRESWEKLKPLVQHYLALFKLGRWGGGGGGVLALSSPIPPTSLTLWVPKAYLYTYYYTCISQSNVHDSRTYM